MVFRWSLSDNKSPQFSRTLLSILAVLNNAVVWMVSTRPPTSKSSSPFNNSLVTLPNAPIAIGIIVTFMFHSFSIPKQSRGTYPSFHFLSVLFCDQLRQQSPQFCQFSFFFFSFFFFFLLLIIIRSGLLAEIKRSVCMSKSHGSLCVTFFTRDVHIPFVCMVKFKFLAHLPVDHLAHLVVSSLYYYYYYYLLLESFSHQC